MPIRYRVLGPLGIRCEDGSVRTPGGPKQRLLLAALIQRAPRIAGTDWLVDVLWGDATPEDPTAALQTQVSRLRGFLRDAGAGEAIGGEAYGYRLAVEDAGVDADRLEGLVAAARDADSPEAALPLLDEAAELARGGPYEEFADHHAFGGEVARLSEVRTAALERRVEVLLALGRTGDATAACEPLVRENPLRERPCALLMEALYRAGRQGEALAVYQRHRRLLSEELGLDPSPALRRLELQILRHEEALAPAQSARPRDQPDAGPVSEGLRLRIHFTPRRGGGRLAWGEAGSGSPIVAPPGWVSSLSAMGAGSDPRSAFLARLSDRFRLVLYDRYGMGLSAGETAGTTLEGDLQELGTVLDAAGLDRATLLALSQAGPPAIAFAARHPDRVARLVLFGTYASGPRTYPREELRATMIALVRAHWGIGAKAVADLLVPHATGEEASQLARVQRESATPEVAARALEAFYAADVSEMLSSVGCPALVLHYTGDRAIPYSAGQEIAALLPDARLVPLDGVAHLPVATDLDRVATVIEEFIGSDGPG